MARRSRKRPHGTGGCYYRDGRWVVQWSEGGKRRTKTLPSESEARQFLSEACAGLKVGRPVARTLSALAQVWLDSRSTMACNYDDRNRWKNHLEPLFGTMKPDEVRVPELKRAVATLRGKGLASGTVGLCIKLVSSLYGDLVEDGEAQLNPVRLLSRKTRAELKSDHDPKKVSFVKDTRDIARIYTQLQEGVARGYMVGVLAGLRTSEVRGLDWSHVDQDRRLIHVQVQAARRGGGVSEPKDDDSRFVPISDALYEVLSKVPVKEGLVCGHLDPHAMGSALRNVLEKLGLPQMTWYQATRHSFASQWVLNGGSLETLRVMMGHSSVLTTERYAHLVPGRFTDADRARVSVEVTVAPVALAN